MRGSKRYPLSGTVHVYEFYAGEYEEGESGRNHENKKRLIVAAPEILDNG